VTNIRSFLWKLQYSIRNVESISAEMEENAIALVLGKVPPLWWPKSFPTVDPVGLYITKLTARVTYIKHWVAVGHLPAVWLPGLFHPREFVIAILQRHARITQLPLEQIANSYSTNLQAVFSEEGFTHVQQHSVASCTATHFQSLDALDGVVIGGLNLMGCYFDESTDSLRAQDGLNDFGQDTSPAPLVYMRPRAASKVRNRGVTVPVYQVPNYVPAAQYLTSNYIFSIPLPVTSAPNDWILRGVSLVCNCEQA